MNLRQKAAKGVIWSAIQKWGREAISLLTFIVLSRLLDPEAFGLVALTSVFIVLIQVFLDQGFSAAIVQRAELDPEHLDTAFWTSVITGTLLTTIVISASGVVAALLQEPRLILILKWLSISFIFGAFSSTQIALLQRDLAFKGLAVRSLTATVVGGITGVSMALAGFGVWSLVAQNLVKSLTGAIVLWLASDWRPGFKLSPKHYKELFAFGAPIIGTNLLKVLNRRLDHFLIGYFLGATLLGYYSIGYRLLLVMIRLVTGIINSVAFPIFSRIHQDPKRIRPAFYNVTQYSSLLAFPVFIGLAALASELIPALFGQKWLASVPVMQILALSGILQSMLFFNGSVMKACGKPSWQFGFMLVSAVCNVIGFLIVVRWGIVAVAASCVVVGYLLSPISYLAVRKLIAINFGTYLKQFVAPLSATLIMLTVIMGLKYVFKQQEWNLYLELSIYLSASVLTYLLVIRLTARQLFQQVLELVGLVLPEWKLRKFF